MLGKRLMMLRSFLQYLPVIWLRLVVNNLALVNQRASIITWKARYITAKYKFISVELPSF